MHHSEGYPDHLNQRLPAFADSLFLISKNCPLQLRPLDSGRYAASAQGDKGKNAATAAQDARASFALAQDDTLSLSEGAQRLEESPWP